jgi:flagellar biosynthetic protein FliO
MGLITVHFLFLEFSFAQEAADSSAVSPLTESAEPLNMTWMFFKTMGLLAVIIILILISVYLIKKYIFNPSDISGESGWIRVLGQTQIHPKKILTLVMVLDRVILLGVTDSHVENLAEFNNTSEIQPLIESLDKKTGVWQDSRFLKLIKRNLES